MKKEDFLVRIVDDDPNQRDGLELVLSLRGWKSKAYPDGTTFLNEDNFLTPGCVILDLAMPEKDGLQVQKEMELKKAAPTVIFLSAHGDLPKAVEAMKNGAVDFLEKPVDPDKIMALIQTIFRNQQSDSADDKAIELWENLSGREKQIATLYSKGNSQREISDYLSLQQKTINAHIQNIYKKLGMHSREEIQKLLEIAGKAK